MVEVEAEVTSEEQVETLGKAEMAEEAMFILPVTEAVVEAGLGTVMGLGVAEAAVVARLPPKALADQDLADTEAVL